MANKQTNSGKKSTASRSAASASSRSKSAAGASGSRKNYSTAGNARERSGLGRDIAGIVLIVFGVLLAIFCYFGSSGLLSVLASFMFGLFGVVAYAIPVLFVLLGVLFIALPESDLRPGTIVCLAFIFHALLGIVHVFALHGNFNGAKFGEAISSAYKLGSAHHGGGFFGGAVAYLFVALFGSVGSVIALIGVILIAAVLLTHFSVRAHMQAIREAHRAEKAPRKKQRPYNEELTERRREKVRNNDGDYGIEDDDTFIEHSGAPLTSGDTDYDYEDRRTVRPSSRASQVRRQELEEPVQRLRPRQRPQRSGDGPDFLPSSGPLDSTRQQRRRRRHEQEPELKDSFNVVNGNSMEWRPSDAQAGTVPSDNLRRRRAREAQRRSGDENEQCEGYNTPEETDPPAPPADDPLAGVVITHYNTDSLTESFNNEQSPAEGAETAESDKTQPGESADGSGDAQPGGDSFGLTAEVPTVYEYQRPPLSLLHLPDPTVSVAAESPEEKARILIETLNSFNISARVVNISVGPVITRYELQPAQGVRVNRITSLSNDIALALAAPRVRIEAPIPGKSAIGIEIPNSSTAAVLLRELLETNEFNTAKSPLTFALGKDIAGKVVLGDLSKMPHMLVAGQTGSGKSVCINGIILSMVYKSSPKDVRMILIDPKVVELSIFSTLPHLFCPVVTEPKKAAGALRWAVNEMDSRYRKMADVHARDIDRYNAIQKDENERWPRLVIIIDELADLMLVAAKDVEDSICRIAQLGRACGIHLIVATQRPSVDVITGLIKANIPSRIAFAVSNGTDSRVILDAMGAEKLLGRGDMLFHPNGASKPTRAQGAFVDDDEVEAVAEFFTATTAQKPEFHEDVLSEIAGTGSAPGQGNGKQEDDLLPDAVRLVIESGQASISMVQRRLRVGYARAARLIDIMEQKGYVSPADGAKPRRVLIDAAEYNRIFGGDIPVSGGEQQ